MGTYEELWKLVRALDSIEKLLKYIKESFKNINNTLQPHTLWSSNAFKNDKKTITKKVAFTMINNKAQSQTLERIELDLLESVYPHG